MTSLQASRPDRMTGLPPGVVVGPLGRRFVASLVDAVVPTVIGLVAFRPAGGGSTAATVVGPVLIAIWGLVVWWMFATRAAGPGMRLMKLQLVGFTDGRPIGWGRFLLRAAVLALLSLTGLGLLLMVVFLLRHPRRQGWHDLAAASVVIQARMLAPRTARPATATVQTTAPQKTAPQKTPPQTTAPAAPPARPTPSAAPAATPVEREPNRWVAVLEDGRELVIAGLVLLGRNPQPRPGEEGAELVKLSDESRTVSKSHLALDVGEHGLFIVDRDSTNGSTLTTAAGESFRCVPGQVTYVGDGAVVSIGDHRLTVRLGAPELDQEQSRPR